MRERVSLVRQMLYACACNCGYSNLSPESDEVGPQLVPRLAAWNGRIQIPSRQQLQPERAAEGRIPQTWPVLFRV